MAFPEDYIGSTLYVETWYGWGWGRRDDWSVPVDYNQISAAGGFHLRVKYFWKSADDQRGLTSKEHGLVGVVEQPNHLFDGFWTTCEERGLDARNFTDRLCLHWNLNIGPGRPAGGHPRLPSGSPLYSGYGVLAQTAGHLQGFWDKRCQSY